MESPECFFNDTSSDSSLKWANYHKHKPSTDVIWKEIVKSTKTGPAKYKPGIDIEKLEMHA